MAGLAGLHEFGLGALRASTALLNGSEEREHEEATLHVRVDLPRSEGGRPAVERKSGAAGGRQGIESVGGEVCWLAQCGGMKAGDVKRLKEPAQEKASLKGIVADHVLEVAALKQISRGNW